MSRKSLGITSERELVHILQSFGFAAIRVAGSGSTKTPSADILAGNGRRVLCIECKTVRTKSRYISKEQIREFLSFAQNFGCECWIAVKFIRNPWKFLLIEDLLQTEKNYLVTKELCEQKGVDVKDLA